MKKTTKRSDSREMRAEYDFSKGVRGKYYGRVGARSRVFLVSEGVPASVVQTMRSAFRKIRKQVDDLDNLLRKEERRLDTEKRVRRNS